MSATALLAASGVAVVWMVLTLVTTVALVALLIALVRHAMLLGRAVARFNEEAGPILREMSEQAPRGPAPAGGRPAARGARGGGRR